MSLETIQALAAIAEGYPITLYEDQYIVVENPDYLPNNGTDPFLVIDTHSLKAN